MPRQNSLPRADGANLLEFAQQSTRGEGRVVHVGGTRGSTLLVRVEDVVLRLHGHMARVSAV
jgi:hypothetical protein